MVFLLLLAVVFYLYRSGEWKKWSQKLQHSGEASNRNEAKHIIDIRYASGQISAEEYSKIKNLL